MTRFRAVVLLVVGCALAMAGASTGPFLEDDREVAPFTGFRRVPRIRVRPREGGGGGDGNEVVRWGAYVLEAIFIVIVGALLLWAAYWVVRGLVRLTRLRLARADAEAHTEEYDPGELSREDAATLLRSRVADELRLLSVDLDAEVEPREAVIACYVRMEAALAGAGAARADTETPLELLRRVLDAYDVPPADVRRLTDLFTEARFSQHPVTDEMREAARRSLRSVADALAAGARA